MDKNIVLIGMPGCGKSTFGKVLAKELNLKFYDMDDYIEKTTKRKISDIFLDGEEAFRKIESEKCAELSEKKGCILSTGGGIIKNKINIDCLKKNGIIIFIDRPVDKIIKDVDTSERPLLKDGKEKIIQLYSERYDLYKKYADVIVLNVGKISSVKAKLLNACKELITDN